MCPEAQCNKRFCRKVTLTKHLNREHGSWGSVRRRGPKTSQYLPSGSGLDRRHTSHSIYSDLHGSQDAFNHSRTSSQAGLGMSSASDDGIPLHMRQPYFPDHHERRSNTHSRTVSGHPHFYQIHPPTAQHSQHVRGPSSFMFRQDVQGGMFIDEDDHFGHQDGPHGLQTPQSYHAIDTGYPVTHSAPFHYGAPAVGLGINMGIGHIQPSQAVRRLQAGGSGPFLSPSHNSERYETHPRERCFSQTSNHSTLSAPPVMQHDLHDPHYLYQHRLNYAQSGEAPTATPLVYTPVVKLEEAYSTPVSPFYNDEDLPESLSRPFSEAQESTVKAETSPSTLSKIQSRAVSAASMHEITPPQTTASAQAETFVAPASISPTQAVQPLAVAGPNGLPPPAVAAALATFNRPTASTQSMEQPSPLIVSPTYAQDATATYHTVHRTHNGHPQSSYPVHPAYQYQFHQQHAQPHQPLRQQYHYLPPPNPYGPRPTTFVGYNTVAVPKSGNEGYTLYPTPPTSSQPQFTAQFVGDGNFSPASAIAPRMYMTTSLPGNQSTHHSSLPGGEQEHHQNSMSLFDINASGTQAIVSAPLSLVNSQEGDNTSPSPPSFDQAPTSAQSASTQSEHPQRNYLQAPALSRSYSSPVVPQSALCMPGTPVLRQTPTFSSSAGLLNFDDDSRKSSQFLGVTASNDLMGEA